MPKTHSLELPRFPMSAFEGSVPFENLPYPFPQVPSDFLSLFGWGLDAGDFLRYRLPAPGTVTTHSSVSRFRACLRSSLSLAMRLPLFRHPFQVPEDKLLDHLILLPHPEASKFYHTADLTNPQAVSGRADHLRFVRVRDD